MNESKQIASEKNQELCLEATGSFWDHVRDFRKCLIRSLIIYAVIFFSLLTFSKGLYEYLSMPLRNLLPEQGHMIATGVTTTFMAPMLLTAYTTLLIAAPLLMLSVWQYLKSALYQHEKAVLINACLFALCLFYFGNAFAYFVTLPSVLHFFLMVSPESVVPMTDIYSYLSFCIKLLLVFGFTFEIPLIVLGLVYLNVVSVDVIQSKRRFFIVGCFFISMFITPPDALSMLMLAIPMCLLFELGLFLAKFLKSRHRYSLNLY